LIAPLLVVALAPAAGAATTIDPLASPGWEAVHEIFFAGSEVVFDEGVAIAMPTDIEDSSDVPIAVHLAPELGPLEEILVIAENNPIQNIARLIPHRPLLSVGLKIRLETSSAVRVAALAANGTWHVGSIWAEVLTPGGCSTPLKGSTAALGARIGEIAFRTYQRANGTDRLKLRIIHPMDTGFAQLPDGEPIPAYYVESVTISDEAGPVLDMETWAAMASDPVITIDVPELRQTLRIEARDSEGLEFEAFR
jgi:sulfur-oxidizing protein SoxY